MNRWNRQGEGFGWISKVWCLGMSLVCMTSCASSTIRTARQLEAGDVVLSGGVDLFGEFPRPRLHSQLVYGVGIGDVSAQLGSSWFMCNAGVGLRVYPGRHLTLGLQGGISRPRGTHEFSSLSFRDGFNHAELRLMTAPTDGALYGGLRLGAHWQPERSRIQSVSDFGLVGGVDLLERGKWGVQVETRFSPVLLTNGRRWGLFPRYDSSRHTAEGTIFVGQVGVALYRRFSARPEILESE